jgi:C-terminal processing protease CtpA/Prc
VQTEELTAELRKREGLSAEQGAVVMDVFPNTPAEEAGLQEADVITKVNDQSISNPEELREAIQNAGPGKEVTIEVARGKRHRQLTAHLEESPVELRPSYGIFPTEPNREIQRLRQRIQQLEQRIRKLEQNRQNRQDESAK